MIIALTHNDEITLIKSKSDIEFAQNIMKQAKQTMLCFTNTDDINQILNDLRTDIPMISTSDLLSMKSIMDSAYDDVNKFVRICNILAKCTVFSIESCTDFIL